MKHSISGEELLVTDVIPMTLPYRITPWKEKLSNQHLTLIVWLLSAVEHTDLEAKVTGGGTAVEIKTKWRNQMTDPMLVSSAYVDEDGHIIYDMSRVKTVAFLEETRRLREITSSQDIFSVMRVPLPFEVEEQFVEVDGHLGYDLLKIDDCRLMHLELLGRKSNYQPKRPTVGFRSLVTKRENSPSL